MEDRQIVVFDLDGVLADFDSAIIQHFGPCDQTLYDLRKRYPDTPIEEIRAFVQDPAVYLALVPIPRGLQKVLQMKTRFSVIALTARPAGTIDATRDWVAKHEFPFDDLIITETDLKPGILASINPSLAFEDSPWQIMQARELGVQVVTFDQPYNRQVPGARILAW